AAIAQPVEHRIRNAGVGGSSPSCGTTTFLSGWEVVSIEHHWIFGRPTGARSTARTLRLILSTTPKSVSPRVPLPAPAVLVRSTHAPRSVARRGKMGRNSHGGSTAPEALLTRKTTRTARGL